MKDKISIKANSCCSMEKERLMSELYECDYCTDSYKKRRNCYRRAARQSGQRSRQCLIY